MPSHLRFRERFGLSTKSSSTKSSGTQPRQNHITTSTTSSPASPGSGVKLASFPAAFSGNLALELAVQKHLSELPQLARDTLTQASNTIDLDNLFQSIRNYDTTHKHISKFRPQAEKLSKFIGLLDRFMGGVAIGIQASPDIASLVVGGVRLAIDIVVHFVEFFGKFSEMLCRFGEWLEPLELYAVNCKRDIMIEAVAAVYGDLLKFCRAATSIFQREDGTPVRWVSVRTFLRLQFEPFEATFAKIEQELDRHMSIVLNSSQAVQTEILQHMEDKTKGESSSSLRLGIVRA